MRPFSLLVKPASFGCNLRCKYCFYLCKEEIFGKNHKMTDEILEQMIKEFLAVPMPNYSIGWQGGEPTTMGLDFFKTAVKYMQKYGHGGKQVSNGLQTNGTLLDDDWGKFLHQYNFLIGLSIDGPKEIHDLNRLNALGGGSHGDVMRGLDVLKRNKVEHNVLCLVNSANVDKPELVYNYFKDLGLMFHQYIECVEYDEKGDLLPFAVSGKQWGEFLCRLFDEWYKNDCYTVSVRLFDSILFRMVEKQPNVCAMGVNCRQYFVVENNGDIFPCDFFVKPEWKLGNIMTDAWEDMYESQKYIDFGNRKSTWNPECGKCPWLGFCGGCCPKNRPMHGDDPAKMSPLCVGWKMFYEHTFPRFRKLADKIISDRLNEQMVEKRKQEARQCLKDGKVSMNAPCPCGSGKKFKRCCGRYTAK